MNRRTFLIIAGVLLVLVVVLGAVGAAGYLINKPFRSEASGQHRPSPDRKWVAHAVTFNERTLFGPRRRFSELRLETAGSEVVRRMVIEDTAEPFVDWRIEGEVFWSRNSSAVTFKCVTGKASLDITLPASR